MAGPRRFEDIKAISPETLAVLHGFGFTTATPVQDATIPLFAGNKDVAVDACTGSGKTLAFIIPVIEKLRRLEEPLKHHQVGAVIVSPTRELAKQIHSVAAPFVDTVPGLGAALLVGGTDIGADVAGLQAGGAGVLVGTPGRLEDVMRRATWLDYKHLEVLVLDEADRLLEMGFKQHLDAIMGRLPKQRRTGLFSATQTEAVEALARAGLRNPVRVNVTVTAPAAAGGAGGAGGEEGSSKKSSKKAGKTAAAAGTGVDGVEKPAAQGGSQVTPSSLQLRYVVCELEDKLPQLIAFLAAHRGEKVIVYFLTCACVEYYALLLRRLLPGVLTAGAAGGGGGAAAGGGGGGGGLDKQKRKQPEQQQGKKKKQKGQPDDSKDDKSTSTTAAAGADAQTAAAGGAVAGAGGSSGSGSGGVVVMALHGKMKQAAREGTLEKFAAAASGVLLATDLAARGLDIPDVGWVVQYDAPQDPAAFVHRVGRTARMGRAGAALALLTPAEEAYVDFLRLRKVPLLQGELLEGAPALAGAARAAAEGDREVMEKATRGYVSYVRGYKEHHCSYIFRLADLPLGRLAMSFGLLRLPRMPELKKAAAGGRLEGFAPSEVDPEGVPYKDKARERQRQALLKQRAAQGVSQQQQQTAATAAKQQAAAAAAAAAQPGAKLTAAKRRQLQQRDELAELSHDYQLLRKLKKGKISQHAYNVAIGASSSDEEEEEEETRQQAAGGVGGPEDGREDGGGSSSDEGAGGKQQHQAAAGLGRYAAGEAALKLQQKKLKKKKKKRQRGQ